MTNLFRNHLNRALALHCAIIVSAFSSVAFGQNLPTEDVLLENLRVIIGDGAVLTDASVLLHGDTIAAVGLTADMAIPANTRRVDLSGKTLLPTLIDAHAHLGYEGFSSWGAQNYSLDTLVDHLNRYAYYGFGAVFSAGSDPDALALRLQRSQANGEIGGARFVFAAGMAPPGQGPNNQFLQEALRVERQTGDTILRGIGSPDQARSAVQAVAELQIPFIKLWVDDRGGSQQKLQPEIYRAAIAEANRLGLAAVVHQQAAADMLDLIDAGTRGFLHGRVEEGFTAEIATAAAQHNVFIVPNLGLSELRREAIGEDVFLAQTLPKGVAERLSTSAQRQLIPERNQQLEQSLHNSFDYMLNANVEIVLGTDAGAVPDHPFGYTGHRELEIFVRHGMSTAQAIAAATSTAAKALGLENTGQVKPGFRADLLILNQNPLEDIRNTRQIYQVYLGGELVDRERLAAGFTAPRHKSPIHLPRRTLSLLTEKTEVDMNTSNRTSKNCRSIKDSVIRIAMVLSIVLMAASTAQADGSRDRSFGGEWRLGNHNQIFQRTEHGWRRVQGSAIAIADGWVIGTDRRNGGYGIYRWNGRRFDRMPGGAVQIGGSYEHPWVINNRGERFDWTGRDWREVRNFRSQRSEGDYDRRYNRDDDHDYRRDNDDNSHRDNRRRPSW